MGTIILQVNKATLIVFYIINNSFIIKRFFSGCDERDIIPLFHEN